MLCRARCGRGPVVREVVRRIDETHVAKACGSCRGVFPRGSPRQETHIVLNPSNCSNSVPASSCRPIRTSASTFQNEHGRKASLRRARPLVLARLVALDKSAWAQISLDRLIVPITRRPCGGRNPRMGIRASTRRRLTHACERVQLDVEALRSTVVDLWRSRRQRSTGPAAPSARRLHRGRMRPTQDFRMRERRAAPALPDSFVRDPTPSRGTRSRFRWNDHA